MSGISAHVSGVGAHAKRVVLQRAGRAYLVGAALPQALVAIDSMTAQGDATTLCYWNAESETPEEVAAEVRAGIAAAAARSSRCDFAIKAPALGYDARLVNELARECRDRGLRLWFDSHALSTADATLDLAENAATLGCDVGVALPARWQRTMRDATRAARAGLGVRIVKGQWSDPEFRGDDLGERLLEVVDRLANEVPFIALATHDDVLLKHACARLRPGRTPFEIQLLHGIPPRRARIVAFQEHVTVRSYAPYGHPSLGYSVRSMWENRRLAGWFVQDAIFGGRKSTLLDAFDRRRAGDTRLAGLSGRRS